MQHSRWMRSRSINPTASGIRDWLHRIGQTRWRRGVGTMCVQKDKHVCNRGYICALAPMSSANYDVDVASAHESERRAVPFKK